VAATDLLYPNVVQSSGALTNWTYIATDHFDGAGAFSFTNAAPTNAPQEFYYCKCRDSAGTGFNPSVFSGIINESLLLYYEIFYERLF